MEVWKSSKHMDRQKDGFSQKDDIFIHPVGASTN